MSNSQHDTICWIQESNKSIINGWRWIWHR